MSEYYLSENGERFPPTRFSAEPSAMMLHASSAQHAGDNNVKKVEEPYAFLTMFDEIWTRLLQLAKQLRDVMRLYNEKKQDLGWQLEVNTLTKSFAAIDSSCEASKKNAVGSIVAGCLMVGGAAFGVYCPSFSEVSSMIGNASGQFANGAASYSSAEATRRAEVERSVADLQSKGSQAYTRNLDEIVQKAREIMQQMMELGRSMVDVYSQALRSLTR